MAVRWNREAARKLDPASASNRGSRLQCGGPQPLFRFLRGAALRERAAELTGYDVADVGEVHWVS
jgi:hypothetical protein